MLIKILLYPLLVLSFGSARRYRYHRRHSSSRETVHLTGYQFGYGKAYPKTWPRFCIQGTMQSPIDLKHAVIAKYKPTVNFGNYDVSGPVRIENNGHTIKVSGFEKWGKFRPYFVHNIDGQMKTYRLVHFQFHWGPKDLLGSEHTFAGYHMPLEVQFVHRKVRKSRERRGRDEILIIAVLGTTMIEPNSRISALGGVPKALRKLRKPGSFVMRRLGSLSDMIPDDTQSFYYYNGSRTVPNCEENTSWVVMDSVLYVSRMQISRFRQVNLIPPNVGYNFRPTAPLNGRKLLKFVK